jgi:hypothetical protein
MNVCLLYLRFHLAHQEAYGAQNTARQNRVSLFVSFGFGHGCVTIRVSAQGVKARAQFFCEERRLFKRSEMAAAIKLVPVNEIGKEALGPTARRGDNLAGENATSHRKIDAAAVVPGDIPACSK